MLNEARKEEVLELAKVLISQQSYSGHEGGVAAELEKYMKANGFDDVTVDKYGNIIGKIKGNRPGKKVLFDGHIDTVPVANPAAWVHDPFKGEVVDGKLYGRGTSDMKGAVASFTAAANFFAKDTARDFPGEIYIAGVVHEECFEGVAAVASARSSSPTMWLSARHPCAI